MADQSDRNCVVPAHQGMTPKPYKSSRFRSVVAIRRVIDVAQMLPEEKLGAQPREAMCAGVRSEWCTFRTEPNHRVMCKDLPNAPDRKEH
jgi:hypothetical protein